MHDSTHCSNDHAPPSDSRPASSSLPVQDIAFQLGRTFEGLTQREREAVAYRLLGCTYEETARYMGITLHGAARNLQSAYQRLDIRGFAELMGTILLDVDGVEEVARQFIRRGCRTDREEEGVYLALSGHVVLDIADRLETTTGTIRNLLRRVYRRLRVSNLTELTARIITTWITATSTLSITLPLRLRLAEPPPEWIRACLAPIGTFDSLEFFALGKMAVYDSRSELWFTLP